MQNLSLAWCALHCIHTHLAVSEQSQVASNPVLDQRPASGVTAVSEMVKGLMLTCTMFSFAVRTTVNAFVPACANDIDGLQAGK